jgi:hypothetical protein
MKKISKSLFALALSVWNMRIQNSWHKKASRIAEVRMKMLGEIMICVVAFLVLVAKELFANQRRGKCYFCEKTAILVRVQNTWDDISDWACSSCAQKECRSGWWELV